MIPLWRIFTRDRTTNPIGEAEAATKNDALHCCDHIVGPHDVDRADRPTVTPPHPQPPGAKDWYNGQ